MHDRSSLIILDVTRPRRSIQLYLLTETLRERRRGEYERESRTRKK
jgi:hypothetical protein